MRLPLVAGNWKMNGLVADSPALAGRIRQALEAKPVADVEVLVCPPYLALPGVAATLQGGPVRWGAQDVHWEAKGAFTGEVSVGMLKEVGCTHAIVGHSERRHIMGEPNDHVNRKLKACLAGGLTPIVCVGELLEERNAGDTYAVIERQVLKGWDGVTAGDLPRAVVAYEPVWAIGTGRTASPQQAQDVHHFIRKLLNRLGGEAAAAATRILYGGSVKPDNIKSLMAQPDVDGALVGGASLDAASFVDLCRYKE